MFLILKVLLLISAALVVTVRSPVHSVLLLVFCFCNAAALLLYIHIDFLAFVYILVYIGAIAVLFLFVVMMLDLRESKIPNDNSLNMSFCFILFICFVCETHLSFASLNLFHTLTPIITYDFSHFSNDANSMNTVGVFLYTISFVAVILLGFILLISMIGSILFSLHHIEGIRRQNVFEQNIRFVGSSIRHL
jgi:NADH-quinone oxidoreductase subunit J